MRMRSAVWMAVGLALAAAGPGAAAAKSAGAKEKKAAKAAITLEGKVQSMDKKKNLLTMKAVSGEALIIKLDRDSKIMRGSKDDVDPSSLKPGKKIRVRYDDRDGTKVARWVLILPEDAAKKGASKDKDKKKAE